MADDKLSTASSTNEFHSGVSMATNLESPVEAAPPPAVAAAMPQTLPAPEAVIATAMLQIPVEARPKAAAAMPQSPVKASQAAAMPKAPVQAALSKSAAPQALVSTFKPTYFPKPSCRNATSTGQERLT